MPIRPSPLAGVALVVCLNACVAPLWSQSVTELEETLSAQRNDAVLRQPRMLRQRARALTELISRDPARALRVAISAETAAALAHDFPGEPVEDVGEWEGTLQTLIIDDFEARRSRTEHYLQVGNDTLRIFSSHQVPAYECGTKVRVAGIRLQDRMAVDRVMAVASAERSASACSTTGVQKTAVLLVSYPGAPNTTSMAQVQAAFQGVGRSLNNYWQEASYGKTSSDTAFFGPYILDRSYTCDEINQVLQAAIRAADGGVDFRNYTRIFLIIPEQTNCALGVGTIGCNVYSSAGDGTFTASVSWIRTSSATNQDAFVAVIAHEGGHNLGLEHAATLDFGANVLGPYGFLGVQEEYGDYYSIMGYSFVYAGVQILGHYNAQQKQKIEWFSPANVSVVSQSGDYTLDALEFPSGGVQALKVQRGSGVPQYLWLEYRRPVGSYDNSFSAMPANVNNGAILVHFDDPADVSSGAGRTKLLDFHPSATPNVYYNAGLEVGQLWKDPYTDLTLYLSAANATSATVSVQHSLCATVTPTETTISAAQQQVEFTIAANGPCSWTAWSLAPTKGVITSGSGTGLVRYNAEANFSASPRTHSLIVAGQPVTITQVGLPCSYSLSASQVSVSKTGGSGFFNVITSSICPWTAVSDASWATIIGSPDGSGNGTVSFQVSPNLGQDTRIAVIRVAGQVFTIQQQGTFCSFVLTPTSMSLPSGGGTTSIGVDATPGCTWSATSATPWITVVSTHALSVTLSVTANSGAARVASISIAGQSVSISQEASTSTVALPSALRFVPLPPCRLADTRSEQGKSFPFGPPTMRTNSIRDIPVRGSCGVPASATAYSLNFTVVPQETLGYLSVWPTGQDQPFVSTLNSPGGQVLANAAIVPAGLNGAISMYVTNATDVIIDINGYFASSGGSYFHSVPPCRVIDTRGNSTLAAGATKTVAMQQSACNLPASAQAYSLNATVVPGGPLSFLTLWPAGRTRPLVSTLNAFQGQVIANAAIVPAGANGAVNVFASDATDVILDVNGYFDNVAPGLSFTPLAPCRAVDTRAGQGTTGIFGPPTLASARNFELPASRCSVPSTAQAYSLNATVVPPGGLAYLTLWPAGVNQPVVSTLNAFNGGIVANAAIVPAGTNGAISAFASNPTELILDISGYFAP